MPALKKLNHIFAGVKFIGNFMNRPIELGQIVQWSDGQHLIMGNLADFVPGFTWTGKIEKSTSAFFKLTQESTVDVALGGQANAPVGKAEVELKFGAKNSAFVALNDVESTAIKLGLVQDDLNALWHERRWDRANNRNKFFLVSEVMTAASGTVVYSAERKNTVVLKAENDAPVTSLKALGSGRFEYVSNTKSTLEIISPMAITPLYRAVSLRSNGLFDLVGA